MRCKAKALDLGFPSQAWLGGRELGKDAFEIFNCIWTITGCFGG